MKPIKEKNEKKLRIKIEKRVEKISKIYQKDQLNRSQRKKLRRIKEILENC